MVKIAILNLLNNKPGDIRDGEIIEGDTTTKKCKLIFSGERRIMSGHYDKKLELYVCDDIQLIG